ncbi:flagellar basal body-associated FliL family protein [Aquamicrobium sp. LC103]|uniref:flagellar basal body-associated FliL family protein n=1 Tax=Aquamicrobium sp. LC103 TaxID=1120658 RepID=UPI00063EAAC5|nr:flagellar basal body-associated FliL family protein [Aquamicrobium sp. LC103]TKT77487.1 flagellar basal body-associated FliL family protein [Aquamicrobium sp. LC103]
MAIIDDTAPPKQEPSMLLQAALLAGLTVAALGIGWLSGVYLSSRQPERAPAGQAQQAIETTVEQANEQLGIIALSPIVTNLAGPGDVWVRLELSLIFEGTPDATVAQDVHQDVLAFLRTVKVYQIEGASGYQHLRSDIEERAVIRSEGKVKGILVTTLLFE